MLKKYRKSFKGYIAVLSIFAISITVVSIEANAGSEKDMQLNYNLDTGTLYVTITTKLPILKNDYLEKVEIEKNGVLYLTENYNTPPKPIFNYSYHVEAKNGDKITVTAYWRIDDPTKKSLTVTGSSKSNNPPNAPNSPFPEDGEINVPIDSNLSWKCRDPDGDTLTYDIYFGVSLPLLKVSSNQSSNTYDPDLDYNTTYYWKIIVWDTHGSRNESSMWHFTTTGKEKNGNNVPGFEMILLIGAIAMLLILKKRKNSNI